MSTLSLISWFCVAKSNTKFEIAYFIYLFSLNDLLKTKFHGCFHTKDDWDMWKWKYEFPQDLRLYKIQ